MRIICRYVTTVKKVVVVLTNIPPLYKSYGSAIRWEKHKICIRVVRDHVIKLVPQLSKSSVKITLRAYTMEANQET